MASTSQIDPRLYSAPAAAATAPPPPPAHAQQQQQYDQQQQQQQPAQHQHPEPARLPPLQNPYQASPAQPPHHHQHHHHQHQSQQQQPSPYFNQPAHHQTPGAVAVDPSLGPPQDSSPPRDEQYTADYASPDGTGNEAPPGSADHKRSRACEACRGLKVKCDMEDPDKPCKRCAKAKRQCIVTAPSRRRQKKQDNRVAELERKIDALTASLHAKEAPGEGQEGAYAQYSPLEAKYRMHDGDRPGALDLGTADKAWREHVERYPQDSAGATSHAPEPTTGHKRRHSDGAQDDVPHRGASLSARDLAPVVWDSASIDFHIDSVMSRQDAAAKFDHYVSDMAPYFPAVVFDEGTTASEVRAAKPTLFLSILAAAAFGSEDSNVVQHLDQLLFKVFADSIVRNGEKRLELIQSLVITSLWYRTPDKFEALNFYQLGHMAAVMAIELGMGKRLSASHRQAIQNMPSPKPKPAVGVDIETLDARRVFLCCYFLACQIAINTRKPNLVRWNAYMDETVEILEGSSTARPSDKLLCHLAKLQHLNEDVGTRFFMDDPAATLAFSDSRVPHALHEFEDRLRNLKLSLPADVRKPWATYNEHYADLYMHEIAMHIDHNIDDYRAPFTVESLKAATGQTRVLSPEHSTAIRKCVEAVQAVMNTFVSFDIRTIRSLPIFYFIRVAYSVVSLNKLYTAVRRPGSDVGRMMELEELKAEELMDKLVQCFDVAVKEKAFRPAKMFFVVVHRLHNQFKSNKDNPPPSDASQFNPYAADAQANDVLGDPDGHLPKLEEENDEKDAKPPKRRSSGEQPQPKKQRHGPTEPNPLETLSDAATMTSNRDASEKYSSNQTGYQQQQGWYSQGFQGQPYTAQQANMNPNVAASYPEDLYNMSYGFDQAMGMALGGGNQEAQANWFPVDPAFEQGGAGGYQQQGQQHQH